MTSNSDSVNQVCLGWTNSILWEAGITLQSLDDLRCGVALVTVVDILWPEAQLSEQLLEAEKDEGTSTEVQNVQTLLDYLTGLGIKVNITAQDVVAGEEKTMVELLWMLILHFSIHSPAVAIAEQTEGRGVCDLLKWCSAMLPGVTLPQEKGLLTNLSQDQLLVHLVAQFCPVEEDQDPVGLMTNAIVAAEEYLGISRHILNPADVVDGTVSERPLLAYLALLRRKSQHIEEMGPTPGQLTGPAPPDSPPWEEAALPAMAETPETFSNITDPQELLAMIGQQPMSEAMLQALEEQFGPIEIEIVEESSSQESSDEQGATRCPTQATSEELESAESYMVWPQQPIYYNRHGSGKSVPLLVELEQAEEVERLSHEVFKSKDKTTFSDNSGDAEEDDHMQDDMEEYEEDEEAVAACIVEEDILPEEAEAAQASITPKKEAEPKYSSREAQAATSGYAPLKYSQCLSPGPTTRGHRTSGRTLNPPWLSPVPFLSRDREVESKESATSEILMHSTPRHAQRNARDNVPGTIKQKEDDTKSHTSDSQNISSSENVTYKDPYEMELDTENLSKEDIQDLLVAAQSEGIPFDPKLLGLAAEHGIELEIIMEDEYGNVIEGLPPEEYMTSSDFLDLVQELKAASGKDIGLSLQHDSGFGTGTGLTAMTNPEAESHNVAASVDLGALQQQIQQHLDQQQVPSRRNFSSSPIEGALLGPQVPTVSLEDLHNVPADMESGSPWTYMNQEDDLDLKLDLRDVGASSDEDCSCPRLASERKVRNKRPHRGTSSMQQSTQQHYYNTHKSDPPQRNHENPLFTDGVHKSENLHIFSKDYKTEPEVNDHKLDSCSTKSSDVDTDNEPDEKNRYSSNRSDKSFSSCTSVDGVIDTRVDAEESEEEIVITMEVPGIPTEDGGFIIDMSKMFIPISIPGQGDQEITVEIDPSGFDFSQMVQNEDGTIEIDIQSQIQTWMANYAQYGSGHTIGISTTSEGGKNTGLDDACDAEVSDAIRAAVTEQLHFPSKTSSEESPTNSGLDIRPVSESSGHSSTQQERNYRMSVASPSSIFDVSPAEDELLQLLNQIGKHGDEMCKELQTSFKRELCLHEEKSLEEARLVESVAALEKELEIIHTENTQLFHDLSAKNSSSDRDQEIIAKLEVALDDLQNRVHALHWENTDLKKVNATLERRSRLVAHKATNTEMIKTDQKLLQVGSSLFSLRQRGTQSVAVNTIDFGVQQCGHYFSKSAMTTTNDPMFKALLTKTTGTQSMTLVQVDHGVPAMSGQERLWMKLSADASTQIRMISKPQDTVVTQKTTQELSVRAPNPVPQTSAPFPPRLQLKTPFKEPIKPDTRYPWNQLRQQERLRAMPAAPLRASHAPQADPVSGPQKPQQTPSYPAPVKANQAINKLFTQMSHNTNVQGESPTMENSATESMDTDEEPEGRDKWQRLSSVTLTSDPTVMKLQRSLASAALENDLLQSKMTKAKREMATRLEEWADLLEASKSELKQAKVEAKSLITRHNDRSDLTLLQQKIKSLEQTLCSAQGHNQHLAVQLDSTVSNSQMNLSQSKVKELEDQNALLQANLAKVKDERDQLVKVSRHIKDVGHLRQHHRHSIEAGTELESSLVGMTSERQVLKNEVQVLRDEYQYMKKGMELMGHYLEADSDPKESATKVCVSEQPFSSKEHKISPTTPTVITDNVVKESEAVINVLKQSDIVAKESEAVLNAFKARDQEEVEMSLHRHISALAARIQSELGIKVQLVGEVDPTEILGASIQESPASDRTASMPDPRDHITEENAVDQLFKSVRSSNCKSQVDTLDTQDMEGIISRAIPSPRDTSRDSSPSSARRGVTPQELMDRSEIEGLDASELRRKRLGMLVDAYTSRDHVDSLLIKARDPSPEHVRANHSEVSRKKINTSNSVASILPSKFNLTSVGVTKGSTPTVMDTNPSMATLSEPGLNAKWRPFSRLAKGNRSKSPNAGGTPVRNENPELFSSKPKTLSPSLVSQQERASLYNQESLVGIPAKDSSILSVDATLSPVFHQTSVTVPQVQLPSKQFDTTDSSKDHSNQRIAGSIPPSKQLDSLFKDYTYTDYLLSKYGGDEGSTDLAPMSSSTDYRGEHESDLIPFSQYSSIVSNINGEMSSSESEYATGYHGSDRYGVRNSRSASKSQSSSRPDCKDRSHSRSPARLDNTSIAVPQGTLSSSFIGLRPSPKDVSDLKTYSSTSSSSPTRLESTCRLPPKSEPDKAWQSSNGHYTRGTSDSTDAHKRSTYQTYFERTQPNLASSNSENHYWKEPRPYERLDISNSWTEPRRHKNRKESDKVYEGQRKRSSIRTEGYSSRSDVPDSANSSRGSSRTPVDAWTGRLEGERDLDNRRCHQGRDHEPGLATYSNRAGLSSTLSREHPTEANRLTTQTSRSFITSADDRYPPTLASYLGGSLENYPTLLPSSGTCSNYALPNNSAASARASTSRAETPFMDRIAQKYSPLQVTSDRYNVDSLMDAVTTDSGDSGLDRYSCLTTGSSSYRGTSRVQPTLPVTSSHRSTDFHGNLAKAGSVGVTYDQYARTSMSDGHTKTADPYKNTPGSYSVLSDRYEYATTDLDRYASPFASKCSVRLGQTLDKLERKYELQDILNKYVPVYR